MYWLGLKLPLVHMDLIRGVEFFTMIFLIGVLAFLLLPIPMHMKQRTLYFFNNRKVYKDNIKLAFRIQLTILVILLADAIRATYIFAAKHNIVEQAQLLGEQDHTVKQEMEANLLVNQRNLYLTAFTLFLLIVVHRFCTMFLRMYQFEEEIGELKTRYKVGLDRSDEGKRQVVLQKERVRVDAYGNPETAQVEKQNLAGASDLRSRPVVASGAIGGTEPTALT